MLSFRPKSPPNSPNNELATFADELKDVYINRPGSVIGGVGTVVAGVHGSSSNVCYSDSNISHCQQQQQQVTASELIWDWSSRPNVPPQ